MYRTLIQRRAKKCSRFTFLWFLCFGLDLVVVLECLDVLLFLNCLGYLGSFEFLELFSSGVSGFMIALGLGLQLCWAVVHVGTAVGQWRDGATRGKGEASAPSMCI